MVLSPPRLTRPVDPDLDLSLSLELDLGPADPFPDPDPVGPGPARPAPKASPGLARPEPKASPDPIAAAVDPPVGLRRPSGRRRRRVVIAAALTVAALATIVAVPRGWWPTAPGPLPVRLPARHVTGLRPPPGTRPKSVIIQARARQRRRHRRMMAAAAAAGAAGGYAAGGGRLPPWHRQRSHSHRHGRGGGTPGPAPRAEVLPGLAALNTGRAGITGLSCPSAGACAIDGYYTDRTGHNQAFVASQVGGKWARAEEAPGTAGLNTGDFAQATALSCPSAGNCLASGFYNTGSSAQQGFLIAENRGTWSRAQPVPGLAALDKGGYATITTLSCSSAGNCAVAGWYASGNRTLAFVVSETHGRWGAAQAVPGLSALAPRFAIIHAISCPSPGNCTAGGTGQTKSGSVLFAVNETDTVWGAAQRIPGAAAKGEPIEVDSISCASAGNCALAGGYGTAAHGGTEQAYVASQANGTWAKAEPVPGIAALHKTGSDTAAVSCPAAGECTAGGSYTDAAGHQQAFIVTQVGGTWQAAEEVPGTAALNAGNAMIDQVSCAAAGTCTAGGTFTDSAGHEQALIVTQTHGTWQSAGEVPGTAALVTRRGGAWVSNLSCPPTGSCGIAGLYYSNNGEQIWVVVTGKR